MLKWTAPEGERMLSRTKVPGPPNSVPAYAADIIACLKANPEAAADVLTALGRPAADKWLAEHDAAIARAEQAERERDEARAERDAKQAGYEALGKLLSETCEPAHGYIQRHKVGHAGEDVVAVVVRDAGALRARLAKAEQVVEAALRKLEATRWNPTQPMRDWQVSQDGENHSLVCYAMSALRALDSDAAPTDSGGSGAAPGRQAVEAAPEPAGSLMCRYCGGPLRFDAGLADGCPCNSRRGINHGLVPTHVCTCDECDPAQTGAVRPGPEPAPYGHVSRADECQLDETVTRAELEELRRRVARLESGPRGDG